MASQFQEANLLLRTGKLEEAVAAYRAATEENTSFYAAYQNLGETLWKLGRLDEAIAAFRQAVALNPGGVWCVYKLGELLRLRGEFEEAVGYLRRAVELKSDVAEFHLRLGAALVKLGEWTEGEGCLRRVLQFSTSSIPTASLAEVYYFLGVIKSEQQQGAEAVDWYRRGWEIHPGSVNCCLALAKALGKLGRWDEAVDCYRQVVALSESGEVLFALGQALAELGRWQEAITEYQRGIALGFAGAEVRHHLGYAFNQLGRYEEAVVELRQVVEVNPKSAQVRHQLGYGLMQLGRWREAALELRKAVELYPRSAVVWQQLGDVLRELGENEEAVEVYKKALEIQPSFELQENLDALSGKQITASNSAAEYRNQKPKIIKQVNVVARAETKTLLQIVIPSFNRNLLLKRLLIQINREAEGFDVSVDVFDDGSKEPVVENASDYPNLAGLAIHRYNNHGKKQYWQLVNHIFEHISKQNVDLFIYMPDDIKICSGFFRKVVSQWYGISDPKKIVLNLGLDNRTQCWTGFERVKCRFGQTEVFKTQWVDMLMLFERSFLEALDYRIQPISLSRWQKDPNLSSGVGQQMSQRLHRLGFSLYQVSEYLISHGDHESMMNPEERKINPLIVAFPGDRNSQQSDRQKINQQTIKLDKVFASLASIPDRIKSLEMTVNSLYPQVDQLNVYLNNYDQIPEFLNREKIKLAQSQIHSDLGDSGKFWWCEEVNGYHFICDDDITYPDNYVQIMIDKIEEFYRKAIVGLHGTIYRQPFFLYHKSRNVLHCFQDNEKDLFVQMIATSSLAYHTSTLKVLRSDFEHVNMADVWFSLLAQQYQVPRVAIKHQRTWLKHNDIDMQNTIYNKSKPDNKNHTLSTRQIQDYVVKKTQPWKINYLRNKPITVMSLITFNSKKYVQEFIYSWEKTKSSKYHWILIIADNGSTDGTVEYLYSIKPFWQFTLIQKQGLSDAELINAIFDECKNIEFDYGFYSDNDVLFLKPGWDELYINAIEKSGYAHLCHQNTEYLRKLVDNKKLSGSVLNQMEQIDASGYCSTRIDAKEYLGATKFFTFNRQTIERVGYADAGNFAGGKEWQIDISQRYSRGGFNDGNKYWDAKGSNEYLQIQGIVDEGNRLVAEYDKVAASLLAKSKIIEDKQRIYVDRLIGDNLTKPKDYDINQYFDNIYLINLDSKINRWHQASEWAKKYDINLMRFLGVDGNAPEHRKEWEDYARQGLVKLPADIKRIETIEEFYFNYQYDVTRVAYIEQKSGKKGIPTPEAWGYLLSVIHVLEDAITNGYQRILVLEDDVVPHESIKSLFTQGMKEAPEDWKIILLGAFQNVWEGYITPYSEHLYQSNGTNEGSFAMALDSSVFVPLLHHAKKFDLAFDFGALHRVQRKYKDKCFVFQPNIFNKSDQGKL